MNWKNKGVFTAIFIAAICSGCKIKTDPAPKPNVIFVFADQWRAQALGYMGNSQVKTPWIDQLARESVNFTLAISNCPVCSPTRASIMTGQYSLNHGIFYNDKHLPAEAVTMAEVFKQNGYATGYIGKWHLNGHPRGENLMEHREKPVPKENRQGFDYWKVLECTHDYNHSLYYDEDNTPHYWEGYDAIAQTDSALAFIKNNKDHPFLLMLSWGPPHAPYLTAPDSFRVMYDSADIRLRDNVPEENAGRARKQIAGYYAHCTALDHCIAELQESIRKSGLEKNTIFVFTSDHGDMLHSHGKQKKQKPWDESIRVPLLIKYPLLLKPSENSIPFSSPDFMPTLLGLSGIAIPESVEGNDFSGFLLGREQPDIDAALIMCPVPFHQWKRERGGKEYRGFRTRRYTYVRDLEGPWLLYDNQEDPYQLNNLVGDPAFADIQKGLEEKLSRLLQETGDEFLHADEYMKRWNYDYD